MSQPGEVGGREPGRIVVVQLAVHARAHHLLIWPHRRPHVEGRFFSGCDGRQIADRLGGSDETFQLLRGDGAVREKVPYLGYTGGGTREAVTGGNPEVLTPADDDQPPAHLRRSILSREQLRACRLISC